MFNTPSEPDVNFFAEFLDDYFAECDEHLLAVRQGLLTLEIQEPQADRALLDDLFRRFHSIKGLSGMVGVREAEQLAHQMESHLRALRKEEVHLTHAALDALTDGARLLEQVIIVRRTGGPPPAIADMITKLAAALAQDLPQPARPARSASADAALADESLPSIPLALAPETSSQLTAALAAGQKAWRCVFIPTPARAEQGVNVNGVRAYLQGQGDLLHAAPRVHGQGGIAFEFLVVSAADKNAFTDQVPDGLICTPYEPPERRAEPPIAAIPDTAPPPPALAAGVAPAESLPAPTLTPSNIVRVDLGRLDDLMRMAGKLVIGRARLEDRLEKLEAAVPAADWRAVQEVNLAMAHQLRDLREGIMRVRMVPIGELFARMQLAVYDLARASGKQVRLELHGQDTEIDKFVIERMMDPLLHLVRNAVSHGLEDAAARVDAGKPAVGVVALRASTAGDAVVIEVADDGCGVDVEKVATRGRALGLLAEEASLDPASLLELLCALGFSTRDEADLTSGRGVGMTVVKNTVQELGGSLTLDTKPGRGTRFTIQLPLTLAIADALIVSVGAQRFAVPLLAVREVIEVQLDAVRTLDGQAHNEVLLHRGGALPILRLARFFGLPAPTDHAPVALVVGAGLTAIGIVVDRVLEQREIVIRSLADPFVQSPGLAGATELGDGRVVLILDVGALTKAKRRM
ncbi:MAG: chemotaxis protein CheA [Chloroflexi bacterium]|nr:chemotaxis protein CheA [Chloroflexota bacterium]